MTEGMWQELAELGDDLKDDPDIRCLVVIGEGRAFSAGIDTSQFGTSSALTSGASGNGEGDPLVEWILRMQRGFTWLEDVPFPTIAAVRGYALGGGLQLATACDLRVVARGSKLGVFEQKYGLLPDLTGTWYLPRLVGIAKAKELTWTVAEIDAEEALRIGLCERVVEDEALEEEVSALAAHLAAQPPIAVRGSKAAMDQVGRAPREEVLRLTAERQAECVRSADFAEAIGAFLEKRPPNFSGK
jgi:enoyl-CoA hydratase/carnithine racemase